MTRKHTNEIPGSACTPGVGAARRPAAPDILRRPLRLPHLPTGGLVMREWRAGLPTAAALAGICLVVWGTGAVIEMANQNLTAIHWDGKDNQLFARLWLACTAIAAAVLGVLCGAEEEENATADFAFRLPIPRLRIFGEKVAGALAAFLTWHALFAGVVVLAAFIADPAGGGIFTNPPGVLDLILRERSALAWVLGYSPLFFCFTLAAGAWIGRVIIAALAGGIAALVYGWVAFLISKVSWITLYSNPDARLGLLVLMIALGCAAALAAAAVRTLTREGR